MSENHHLPLRATLKAGKDYDAPWLTVDGATPEELHDRLVNIAGGGLPQALIEAANALKAANNAAPLLAGNAPAQSHPAQQHPTNPQPTQAQQGGWGTPTTQAAGSVAQSHAQRPQQNQYGGPPHPEGKACELPNCGNVLEFKKTSSGKGTWRCPDWRWNNGNPNGHTQEWA